MNSFSMSFCPFTCFSSCFWGIIFCVFKEFFRDFRCLLPDLELKDDKLSQGLPGSCTHVLVPQSTFKCLILGEMDYPRVPSRSWKERKSWARLTYSCPQEKPQRNRKQWEEMEGEPTANWADHPPATKCSPKAVFSFHDQGDSVLRNFLHIGHETTLVFFTVLID